MKRSDGRLGIEVKGKFFTDWVVRQWHHLPAEPELVPGVVSDSVGTSPTCSRGVGTRWSLSSLPTQPSL